MASLTPMDIENVEFKKTPFKGYSCEEVDLFLDKVIVEYERLFKENGRMADQISAKDEVISHYKDLEETIKSSIVRSEKTAEETLKNANTTAEQILQGAEKRAQDIIKDAQLQADNMLKEGNAELADIRYQVSVAKAEYIKVKKLLKNMLDAQLEVLESSNKTFENEIEANLEQVGEEA